MLENIFRNVREKGPYVHNITNYVTVNDCANIILACGASPIMADDLAEAAEITSICNSLVINIGTLNERTIPSMFAAGKRANECGIPVILDPVGVGASKLRTETALRLMEEISFRVIRGNASEIRTLYYGKGRTSGVDVNEADRITKDNIEQTIFLAQELCKHMGAVIAVTGETDIVTDQHRTYIIRNGHPMMSKITGTGCMLTAVIGALCGGNPLSVLESAAAGVCAMGICGEAAYEKTVMNNEGTAAFKMHLIDTMSNMEDGMLRLKSRLEERISV